MCAYCPPAIPKQQKNLVCLKNAQRGGFRADVIFSPHFGFLPCGVHVRILPSRYPQAIKRFSLVKKCAGGEDSAVDVGFPQRFGFLPCSIHVRILPPATPKQQKDLVWLKNAQVLRILREMSGFCSFSVFRPVVSVYAYCPLAPPSNKKI
jgi:hypothetical protein